MRVVVWLQVLAVMAVCHVGAVTTDFNATHKVARSALLSDHSDHGDGATTRSILLALWRVHISAHRRDEEACRRLGFLASAHVVDTTLLL